MGYFIILMVLFGFLFSGLKFFGSAAQNNSAQSVNVATHSANVNNFVSATPLPIHNVFH